MNTIAIALALALALTSLGGGLYNQTQQFDVPTAALAINATDTLNWTQCIATTGEDQISIPHAKTESECISLALKCVTHDDVQWTYHPFYVTTDSSFKRCELTVT